MYVTNRINSYYAISLEVTDTPDNIVGDYSISVGAESNNDTLYLTVVGKFAL